MMKFFGLYNYKIIIIMNHYSSNNLKNSDRKLKLFSKNLLPFAKQLVLILSVNELFENNFDIIGNPTMKNKFHSELEKTMKYEFELNQDQFNIENNFFKLKKKEQVSKNKKTKNIILNSIVIDNNRTEYFIIFNTKFRSAINNKLEVFDFVFKINIGKINLNNKEIKFFTYSELFETFKKLEEKYNVTTITKLSNIYESYLKDKENFIQLTNNFEQTFKRKNLEIMLQESFNEIKA